MTDLVDKELLRAIENSENTFMGIPLEELDRRFKDWSDNYDGDRSRLSEVMGFTPIEFVKYAMFIVERAKI